MRQTKYYRNDPLITIDCLICEFQKLANAKKIFITSRQFSCNTYKRAKIEETKRNLLKAAQLYYKAALKGQKIQSCIKDFGSVVHQIGETTKAVNFLEYMKAPLLRYLSHEIQLQKYDNLIRNFRNQEDNPTGKHNMRKILLDLKNIEYCQKNNVEILLQKLFRNTSRIKNNFFSNSLDFAKKEQEGRFLLLQFESFSGAKKTLQTFQSAEWFEVQKYWVNIKLQIGCKIQDGRLEFEEARLIENKPHNLSNKTYLNSENEKEERRRKNEEKIRCIERPNWDLLEKKEYR